jgi:hypothetical protein
MDGRELPAVLRACKLNETIIRQLILKVDPALVEPLLAIATGEGIPLTNFTDDQATTTTAVGAPDVEAAI